MNNISPSKATPPPPPGPQRAGPSGNCSNYPHTTGSTKSGMKGQYVLRGVGYSRGGEVKVQRKCVEVACHPSVIFLASTILVTSLATVLLSFALTGQYWEMMNYDINKVNEIARNNSTMSVKWMFNGKVSVLSYDKDKAFNNYNNQQEQEQFRYLLPLHSGVWISCIDLQENEFHDLQQLGLSKQNKCVDHLEPDIPKPTETRAAWQHRMQNLAIACAIVCLILLGAAIFVGLFGILRPQISAVLVTGVIYVLSATFATFTLAITHLKHKNRNEFEPLGVWTRLIPELADDEFRSARVITHGGSLQLAWAGSVVCVVASIMWILLSKMMRYNPISLFT